LNVAKKIVMLSSVASKLCRLCHTNTSLVTDLWLNASFLRCELAILLYVL